MALGKGLSSLLPQSKSRKTIHKETGNAAEPGQIWHITISEIVPNSEQPRKSMGHQDLEDLVKSIKKHGILQPITVTERNDGGYELIAGERRLRASQIAGLPTIPAIVRAATQQEKLELALIENLQREDLNPIEEAFAYKRLHEEFGLSHDAIAEQVGKSRPVVSNTIRLLDLPEGIQKSLIDGAISEGKARALLSLRSEKDQLDTFRQMTGQGITVRDVERAVAAKGERSRKGSIRRDANILAQEQMIEDRLGAKVTITRKGEKGTILIHYYSNEEFTRLMGELT